MTNMLELPLPNIGLEIELVILDRDGNVIYDEDVIESIVDELELDGFCVDYEHTWGSTPPRVELKLCKPIKNVREIVNYVADAIDKICRLGYNVRLGTFGKHSGSIHVTLDYPLDRAFSLHDMFFLRSYLDTVLLFDNVMKGYTCYRASTYDTLSPTIPIHGRITMSRNDVNENKMFIIDDSEDLLKIVIMNKGGRELLEALASGRARIDYVEVY